MHLVNLILEALYLANDINRNKQAQTLEISEKQIEIFARRLLPEIKKFFANEDIRKEFEEWQRKRREGEAK